MTTGRLWLKFPGPKIVQASECRFDPAEAVEHAYDGSPAWLPGPPPGTKATKKPSSKASTGGGMFEDAKGGSR